MYRLLLAVPFLVGVAVLQGLTVEIDTFHGTDAGVYQVPTIELFRERLDFSDYPSAQTPLFHLVMAGWESSWASSSGSCGCSTSRSPTAPR